MDEATPSSRPRSGVAALIGLIAGIVTVGIAEFFAGIFQRAGWSGGTPSPILAVGGAFIDRTPAWLKTFAVGEFGTHDKQVLLAGIAVVLILLSLVIGLLARRYFTGALVLFLVLIAVAAAAITSRPHARPVDLIPLVIGAVAGMFVLSGMRNALFAPVTDSAQPDRRRVLLYGSGAAVGAIVVGLAGRAWSGAARAAQAARDSFVVPKVAHPVTVPAGASVGVKGMGPFVVPNGDFYRIDTALTVPEVDPSGWKLKVTGMVDREVELSWEELLAKPMQQAMVTLMCVSNEVGGDLTGNAIWTGWPVRDLLRMAGVQSGADMVLSRSVDGFTASTPLQALTDDRNALIAVAMNGSAIPAAHGFPARLVVPGLYGYVSATKWVTELKVTTYAKDMGYWTSRGWSAKGPVKTSSRIDVPRSGAKVAAGTVAVAGVAWRQHVGISKVQVKVDDGDWQAARLGTDATIDAWREWIYEWPATKGHHTVTVRAVDADGAVQTAAQAPPAPNGSTGYHSISVTVA